MNACSHIIALVKQKHQHLERIRHTQHILFINFISEILLCNNYIIHIASYIIIHISTHVHARAHARTHEHGSLHTQVQLAA